MAYLRMPAILSTAEKFKTWYVLDNACCIEAEVTVELLAFDKFLVSVEGLDMLADLVKARVVLTVAAEVRLKAPAVSSFEDRLLSQLKCV
jgi:hypothetical protein